MDVITFRLPEELKARLDQEAKARYRPLSNLIRFILLEWLEKQTQTLDAPDGPSDGPIDWAEKPEELTGKSPH